MTDNNITTEVHPNPSRRWTNRRRMAWVSLVSAILYPLLAAIAGDSANLLVDISGPFYIFVGLVVGAYVGFATLDDKWRQQ